MRLSGQALYRRAGESDQGGLRVDHAQADWRFYQTENSLLGLKFGKFKLPHGLDNETRDVSFTRPGILLPQSVYIDNSRDLLLAAPGVFLHGARVQEYGATEFQLGWVRPDFDSLSVEYSSLGNTRPGKLKGTGAIGARLRWDATPNLMLRAEFHHVDGTAWLPSPDNPVFLSREQRWNM